MTDARIDARHPDNRDRLAAVSRSGSAITVP